MAYLEQLIYDMEWYGIRDVLVPFILIFTVVYAVLQKSKILGEGDEGKKFNIIIALVMALGVVFPHVLGLYGERSVVDIINSMIPQVSLFIVAIIMLMLMLGVWGKNVKFAGTGGIGSLAVLLSIVFLVLIFLNSAGIYLMPDFLYFLTDPDVVSLVVIILVFGLIIRFITSEPDDKGDGAVKKIWKSLEKVIGD